MQLLRIVSTFKTKKGTDIGRQTNFVKLSDFDGGKEVEILLRGKKADKIILKIMGT